MSTWSWVFVAVATYLVLSAVVALVVSGVLRRVSHGASEHVGPDWQAIPAGRAEIEEELRALAERRTLRERLAAYVRALTRQGSVGSRPTRP